MWFYKIIMKEIMEESCFERFKYRHHPICKAQAAWLVVKYHSEMYYYLLVPILLLFCVLTLLHMWNWRFRPAAGSVKAVLTFCSAQHWYRWPPSNSVFPSMIEMHYTIVCYFYVTFINTFYTFTNSRKVFFVLLCNGVIIQHRSCNHYFLFA